MSKKSYIGIDNTAHEVKKTYIGIGGVARAVKKVYIGVNGIAKEVWSAAKPFISVVDFGAVVTSETPNTSGTYFKAITITPPPAGWDTCTHVTVNGKVYEVTRQEFIMPNGVKTINYTPVGDCKLNFIQCLGQVICNLNFKEPGTYTVQLGVLA